MRRIAVIYSLLLLFAQGVLADPAAFDGVVVTRSTTAMGGGYVRLNLAGAHVRDVFRVTRKGVLVGEVMICGVDGVYAMVIPVPGRKVDMCVGDAVTFVGHREANVQNGLTQAEADRVMAGIRARTARLPVPSSSRAQSSTWNPPDIQSSFTNFRPGQITDSSGRSMSTGTGSGQVGVSAISGGTLGLSNAATDRGMASSSSPAASTRSTGWNPPGIQSSFVNFSPGQITDATGEVVSPGLSRSTPFSQQQVESASFDMLASTESTTGAQVQVAQSGVCRFCQNECSGGITGMGGGFFCDACLNLPVTDPTKVEYNLYPFVTEVFERKMGWPTVCLTPNIEMEVMGPGLLGYWPVESSSFTPGANHFGVIKVKRGTPTLLMLGVIAHEWAHAWWNRSYPNRMGVSPCNTLLYQEGFATWAMARFYQEIGKGDYFNQRVLPTLPENPYRRGYLMFLSGTFKP